ncbi:hypothetical protein BB427_01950 [Pseudoalteromonas sp. BMB]|uniref:hypothetical protein n=1 Tax=Pseudoalteromonas sp. BMB TaxID=1874619 RepID=UPI00083D3108|nr:hypothetical protein [Pseudoalteromonas sp. BMB]ODB36800.1 hypothetical protein BB427_01950 [Pseudoalteromonas sp. BMB]
MRGLYVNANLDSLPHVKSFTEKHSRVLLLPRFNGCLIYSEREWQAPPVIQVDGHELYVAGWFVYKSKRNALSELLHDLITNGIEVLKALEAGSFVGLWVSNGKLQVINDPFGLSSHYIDKLSAKLKVAPAVRPLLSEHKINAEMQDVLAAKQHMFGNFTLYDGIERLEPGAVTEVGCTEKYIDITKPSTVTLEAVSGEIERLVDLWPKTERVLPISSGMDSRLILASSEFSYGFTYGPEGSPEREIAQQYAPLFDEYYGYEYKLGAGLENEAEIIAEMSHGLLNPIGGLLSNYDYISQKFCKASAFFEGYLGDVLQRATYITPKGWKGELYKLFPLIYSLFSFSAETILKARYSGCNARSLSKLLADFDEKTKHLNLTDYQKVTYYEFLYGRGGRYVIFGSNVMAAQCFSVIPPFASVGIFSAYINQNFSDAFRYKLLKNVWACTEDRFKKVKVESGYTPMTHHIFIPPVQLLYRVLFHLIPSRANYGIQMQRENSKEQKKK